MDEIPEILEHKSDGEILRDIWCDVKGLKDDYKAVRLVLYGNGKLGMAGKVNVMWGVAITLGTTAAAGILGYLGWLIVR